MGSAGNVGEAGAGRRGQGVGRGGGGSGKLTRVKWRPRGTGRTGRPPPA